MATDSRQDVLVEPTLAPPTDTEILAQLDRIRLSTDFDAPDRDRKFLAYVIEETLAGRGERIKAYSIATEVFGRDASFDPQTDPAVRIEAGRIRRALERYYLVAGRNDPIVIRMPKGAYVPTFERRAAALPKADPTGAEGDAPKRPAARFKRAPWTGAAVLVCAIGGLAAGAMFYTRSNDSTGGRPNLPKLLVAPFEDLTGTQQSAMMTRGLADEVVINIAKFKEIIVLTRETPDAAPVANTPSFALEGRVRLDKDRLRLGMRLVDRSDGSVVWTNNYDEHLEAQGVIDIQASTAAAVASAVAQPYGIIFQASAARFKQSIPDEWQAYACTLAYYRHRNDVSPQSRALVQECLEKATGQFPTYATAWALLSMSYMDEEVRNADHASALSMERATEAAARAVELDPRDVRALQAQMLTLSLQGKVEPALAAGARALAINPNDAELAGEYGFRLALSGQWEPGCKLVSESVAHNLGPTGSFEAAMAICSYFQRDYVTAERWARLADARDNPADHAMFLAILGKLGKTGPAQDELKWIETNVPGFLANIRSEIALRIHRPEDQQRILDGLRDAGVPLPEPEFEQARSVSSIR